MYQDYILERYCQTNDRLASVANRISTNAEELRVELRMIAAISHRPAVTDASTHTEEQ